MSLCGIYRVTHRASKRHYIGQSVNVLARFRDHIKGKGSRKLCAALRKYGPEAFDFQIILRCERSELNAREAFCVRVFNSLHPSGFNLIGGGQQPDTWTVEARRNFSAAGKKRHANGGAAQLAAARAARWNKPGAREQQAALIRRVRPEQMKGVR